MNNEIFDNPVLTILHDEDNDYMTIKWKAGCGNILSNNYTDEVDIIKEKIRSESPGRLLVDMSGCSYSITSETGPWYKNNLFSMYGDPPPGKVAIVLPDNLTMHASFDAVSAHENLDTKTRIQYFKDSGQANDWLR
jgi:hypothetical protein